ncbi:MAG: hypothetical protein FJZ01_24460 [Candidatus Sericytochromatia bacterium]|nr:hypothetical protein [Candidatus Tanganyikabacteria bacterium]
MSWLNDRLEGPLRKAAADPRYRPAIDAVLAAQKDDVAARDLAAVARQAMRDQYVRDGRRLDPEDINYDAHLAASVAALEKPYQLGDVPAGGDKAQHYWVSGAISSKVDAALDKLWVVPGFMRRGLGVGISMGLGFLKEVADVFGSGFSTADLSADWRGATGAFRR